MNSSLKLIAKITTLIEQLPKAQYISWLFFLYIFKDFNLILFARLRHKRIVHYAIDFWLTIISTVFLLILLAKISGYYDVGAPKSNDAYYIEVTYNIYREKDLRFNLCLGIIIAIQWIRVFMVFQASPVFGKLVEIIINMISEILKFMIILIIILVAFSSAGRMLFFDISIFQSDTDSIIYLISAALGNFNYAIFDASEDVNPRYYGYVYQTIYLIMISIVLLNFLIAILSEIYK